MNKPELVAKIEETRVANLANIQEVLEGVKTRDIPLDVAGELFCCAKHFDEALSELKHHPEAPDGMPNGVAFVIKH